MQGAGPVHAPSAAGIIYDTSLKGSSEVLQRASMACPRGIWVMVSLTPESAVDAVAAAPLWATVAVRCACNILGVSEA